jgi:hypothetical protein
MGPVGIAKAQSGDSLNVRQQIGLRKVQQFTSTKCMDREEKMLQKYQLKFCFRRIALVEGSFGMKRPLYSGYAHFVRTSVPSDPPMLPFPDSESTQVMPQGSRPTKRIPTDRAGRRGADPARYSIDLAAFRPVRWTHSK